MADTSAVPPVAPIGCSPIRPVPPVEVRHGWEVSARRSYAPLTLADRTPLAKVLVRARPTGRVAARLGVPFGRSRRVDGTLVVGSGPGEWLLIAAPGTAGEIADRVDRDDDALVSVLDLTHGRALLRLRGPAADRLLAKVCAVDLADGVTPEGAAFRTSVAQVATDVVRDGVRSYLLHCERSAGQYLHDALLDAGREFGAEPTGFGYPDD